MAKNGFGNQTSREGRNSIVSDYVITGPLIDGGNGVRVGTMGFRMNVVFSAANTDTAFNHPLGRVPNGYKKIRSSVVGDLYDASTGVSAWTALSITLRASAAGMYSFEVL